MKIRPHKPTYLLALTSHSAYLLTIINEANKSTQLFYSYSNIITTTNPYMFRDLVAYHQRNP